MVIHSSQVFCADQLPGRLVPGHCNTDATIRYPGVQCDRLCTHAITTLLLSTVLMEVGIGYTSRDFCDGQSLASSGRWIPHESQCCVALVVSFPCCCRARTRWIVAIHSLFLQRSLHSLNPCNNFPHLGCCGKSSQPPPLSPVPHYQRCVEDWQWHKNQKNSQCPPTGNRTVDGGRETLPSFHKYLHISASPGGALGGHIKKSPFSEEVIVKGSVASDESGYTSGIRNMQTSSDMLHGRSRFVCSGVMPRRSQWIDLFFYGSRPCFVET